MDNFEHKKKIYYISDVDFKLLDTKNRNPNDVAVLPFSSGTSGLPKGVMLTHNNIGSNCEMLDAKLPEYSLTLPTTNDFQDIFPCVLPMFHVFAFTCILISKLSLGCKIVTLPKFTPIDFLGLLTEHKATFLFLAPPLFLFLANSELLKFRHLEQARTIAVGAAPIGSLDAERLKKRYSIFIRN